MTTPRRQPTLGRTRHIHMVGIGGIGMSSIAEVLLARGFAVSGSDLESSDITRSLAVHGARIHLGHDASHAEGADVVVYSSAVDPGTNPETQYARRHHVPLIGRPEMLGELMRMKFGVGIAGTHGKTTTTTMTGHVVAAGGFDPTVIVGGKVSTIGTNAVSGSGDIIVIEADEYDRTFLRLTPSIAIVTNVDADHLDCYRDLDDIRDAFVEYVSRIPFFGAAIVCIDDKGVESILPRLDRRTVTYGTSHGADVRAEQVAQEGRWMSFNVVHHGRLLGRARLNAPGLHNVRNGLAAIATGLELGIDVESILQGLSTYEGVHRRMQETGEVDGVLVVDDYAHHPVEVEATLSAARGCWPQRRLLAVFQPHMYSRTQQFATAFARALRSADVVVVTDVYAARETPEQGARGDVIANELRTLGHPDVDWVPRRADVGQHVSTRTRAGDVVITLGAGDIWRESRALLEILKREGVTA
ncbi:MAG: UDP-N-acetylmuramate--L-alanine ligase [Bacteroidetes bacterium CG12_big_fil_rev_8_21_14_0_65_60_17]|nr:MAG: UDP-N-acetylmuramate--L-alanine ligase [Bacteroidetes bacterium CG12_big_fil_rev_8_21_14_0_65_60_17]